MSAPTPAAPARLLANPHRRSLRLAAPSAGARRFHARLPGYEPSPLHDAAPLARRLGLAGLWLKDDSQRFGLPSFKVLGASWAIARLLAGRFDLPVEALSLASLAERLRTGPALTLVAATDGNHGRAVARVATLLGLASQVLVPAATVEARIAAIAGEGARVEVVAGDYEHAVRAAAALADETHLVVADTAWPGYEQVPAWIVEGYGTLLEELGAQLAAAKAAPLDLLVVPVGVGSLAAAAVAHLRHGPAPGRTRLLTLEPHDAACLMASVEAGAPVTLADVHGSIMAGLNCNTPSSLAWPLLRDGVDALCAVSDETAALGVRALASLGIEGGACAGGTVGALLELLSGPGADEHRARLGLHAGSHVGCLLTEGPTDPDLHRRLVG